MALLNRKGYIAGSEVVVPAYIAPEMRGYKTARERTLDFFRKHVG